MEPKTGTCEHPHCDEACGEDEYCSGCSKFTCEAHSVNMTWGCHSAQTHWEEQDDDYDI